MTLHPRPATAGLLLAACSLALSACSGSHKIGGGVSLGSGNGNANLNLGASSAPPAVAPVATTPPPAVPAPVRTQAPVVVHTQAPAPVVTQAPTQAAAPKPYVITINGDQSGKPLLSPPNVSVYVGTPVQWVNNDTVARSVTATNGAFTSPKIAPGGTWTWTPTVAGRDDYDDGTRPYVTGEIQVYPR